MLTASAPITYAVLSITFITASCACRFEASGGFKRAKLRDEVCLFTLPLSVLTSYLGGAPTLLVG